MIEYIFTYRKDRRYVEYKLDWCNYCFEVHTNAGFFEWWICRLRFWRFRIKVSPNVLEEIEKAVEHDSRNR